MTTNEEYYYNNSEYSTFLESQDAIEFTKYSTFIKSLSRPGDEILDVGCGTCTALSQLDSVKLHLIGLEISETSAQIGKRKGINCMIYDGVKIPFPNHNFDIVGSYNVLEHTNDPICFLNEQYRVLKDRGYLLVVCPNFLSITNGYHHHTRGVPQKIGNVSSTIKKIFIQRPHFTKMKTIKQSDFQPDDDACNVTNPLDIMHWATEKQLSRVYWSSRSTFRQSLAAQLDIWPFRLFLGSSFLIFRK